jgi:hypothetical protein
MLTHTSLWHSHRLELAMSNTTTTIPNKDSEFLLWVGERSALWQANFARVGLTQADANEMKAATSAAQAAYTN